MAIADHTRDGKSNAGSLKRRSGVRRQRARPRAVHLTVAERAALGKAAREVAPRAVHGEWQPAADRRDPVALLEEQAASRVQELVPLRYGRMLVSPFTFFRGAATRWPPTSPTRPDRAGRAALR